MPDARQTAPRRLDPTQVATAVVSISAALLVLALVEVGFRGTRLARSLAATDLLSSKIGEYPAKRADVIVMGDSRVYHGVQPAVVAEEVEAATRTPTRVYNFAVPSGYPSMFWLIARRALEADPPPRLVVVGVSPVMFADTALVPPSHQLVTSALAARDIPALVAAAPSLDEASADLVLASSRLMASRHRVLPVLLDGARLHPHLGTGDRGWVSLGARVEAPLQDARARSRVAGYATPLLRGKVTTANDTYLRALASTLRARGTRLAFFGAPQASQLDVNHTPASMVAGYLAHVRRIADEVGAEFIDMNRCPALADADFVDGDHLSEPGSARFSRYLTRELVVPVLARP